MLLALKAFFAGFKTYFYGAIVVIVIASAVWYTIHERHVGAAKIVARDVVINTQRQKIADQAAQHTKDVQALAQQLSDRLGEIYEETIATPPADSPHVLCNRPAASVGRSVPKAAGDPSVDHGQADSAGQDPVDIGPPLDTIGRDADAQIEALQEQVRVLVDAMNGKTT